MLYDILEPDIQTSELVETVANQQHQSDSYSITLDLLLVQHVWRIQVRKHFSYKLPICMLFVS